MLRDIFSPGEIFIEKWSLKRLRGRFNMIFVAETASCLPNVLSPILSDQTPEKY